MSDQLQVSHYGIHNHEGVAYLHQGRAATNFIGLRSQSPFDVQTMKKRACPHLINTAAPVPDRAHWELFLRLFRDPLVRELLPVPKEYGDLVPYVNDPNNDLAMTLVILSRMGSPIYPVVQPINQLVVKTVLEELSTTNVTPLIITDVQQDDYKLMLDIATEARTLPRKLLFTGCHTLPILKPLARLDTQIRDYDELVLAAMPMETIGAAVLRKYARGEQMDSPYVRKE